jgi:aminomethyltransferase
LQRVKANGVTRKLVGFVPEEKGVIPRHGMEVFVADRQVDVVRSGGYAPSLAHPVGTTYLPTHSTEPGTVFEIGVRGKRVKAKVVKTPFYTKGSVKK